MSTWEESNHIYFPPNLRIVLQRIRLSAKWYLTALVLAIALVLGCLIGTGTPLNQVMCSIGVTFEMVKQLFFYYVLVRHMLRKANGDDSVNISEGI